MSERVIFRRDKSDGEIVALFPALAGTCNDPFSCTCYASMGQHSSASVYFIRRTIPAKPSEYRELAKELRRIGYKLKIAKRFTQSDLSARKEQLK